MVTHWLKCCIRECFFFFHTVIRQSVQIVETPAQICQALFFFFDSLFLSFENDIYPRPPKRAFISFYLLCIKRMQIINIFLKKRISRNQKILKWWSLATLLLPTSARTLYYLLLSLLFTIIKFEPIMLCFFVVYFISVFIKVHHECYLFFHMSYMNFPTSFLKTIKQLK